MNEEEQEEQEERCRQWRRQWWWSLEFSLKGRLHTNDAGRFCSAGQIFSKHMLHLMMIRIHY
jgi:hypothetical protein